MTDRVIELEVTVPAPPERVFAAMTTPEELARFFGRAAWVEPRVGGAFEIYFLLDAPPGSRGSEGCRILEYDPPRRLAFSWNFPPQLATIRNEHTRVVMDFTPDATGGTHVAFRQSEWQDGPDWDEGYLYFSAAWRKVLDNLVEHCSVPER